MAAPLNKAPREFAGQNFGFVAVALSVNGQVLALSNDTGGGITLFETASGKVLHRLDTESSDIDTLLFSPDGTLLAAADRGQALRVWQATTGRPYRKLPGHVGGTYALAFTPDGRTLVSGGRDRAVRSWELFTGTLQWQRNGHTDSVLGLSVSRNGRLLASASADGSVLLHDLTAGVRAQGKLSREETEQLWIDLADREAARAERAGARLVGASEAAVTFLRGRLRPIPAVDETQVRRLLRELEHRRFAIRQRAEQALAQLGVVARPLLRRVLDDKPTLETRRRVERLLEALEEEKLSAAELRAWRAVGLLERMGTPQARRLLEKLAKGAAGAWQTEAAKGGLLRAGIGRGP